MRFLLVYLQKYRFLIQVAIDSRFGKFADGIHRLFIWKFVLLHLRQYLVQLIRVYHWTVGRSRIDVHHILLKLSYQILQNILLFHLHKLVINWLFDYLVNIWILKIVLLLINQFGNNLPFSMDHILAPLLLAVTFNLAKVILQLKLLLLIEKSCPNLDALIQIFLQHLHSFVLCRYIILYFPQFIVQNLKLIFNLSFILQQRQLREFFLFLINCLFLFRIVFMLGD